MVVSKSLAQLTIQRRPRVELHWSNCRWIIMRSCHVSPQKVSIRSMGLVCFPTCTIMTRWWFQIFFIFTPICGRFPFWLYNIFQMGWNHQLDKHQPFMYVNLPVPRMVWGRGQRHLGFNANPGHLTLVKNNIKQFIHRKTRKVMQISWGHIKS